jgi:hypothetical protein
MKNNYEQISVGDNFELSNSLVLACNQLSDEMQGKEFVLYGSVGRGVMNGELFNGRFKGNIRKHGPFEDTVDIDIITFVGKEFIKEEIQRAIKLRQKIFSSSGHLVLIDEKICVKEGGLVSANGSTFPYEWIGFRRVNIGESEINVLDYPTVVFLQLLRKNPRKKEFISMLHAIPQMVRDNELEKEKLIFAIKSLGNKWVADPVIMVKSLGIILTPDEVYSFVSKIIHRIRENQQFSNEREKVLLMTNNLV